MLMLNNKITRLLSRVPEEHVWHINNLWYPAMNSGGIPYPKAYALNSIRINLSAFNVHILKHLKSDLSNYVEAIETAMNNCSREQFSTKKDILFAAKSHLKYLVRKKKINKSVLKEIDQIKLKRIQEPKQPVLSLKDVKQLIEHIERKSYRQQPEYNRQLDQIIIWFLFYTGVRVSELSNLTLECLHLDKDRFKVVNSKGGKSRFVSINKDLRPYLDKYLDLRPKSQSNNVFLLSDGRSLTVDRLEKRISKICKDAGFNKEVSNFFKSYITNFETGATNYAKPCYTEEAYKYLIQSYAVDTDKINPRGINLANGFLRLSYDESSKPVFTLEKHSPEQLNIYICDYEYNPAADDLELNTFLDNVLEKADQQIILRLVASCLDIKTARKRAGRGLRAVINYGDGANGKDTLREIFTQLIGKHRFTSISLQNFKEADSGRRFGIFDLYRSAINWSSENSAINLDKSQTLKAAITGDPIQLERKNKDPIETSPRAIFFFNMNGTPNISSLGEAVKSRLCPIEFKNTFKTNPSSSISTEKKADPRFKEDPEFIKKTILPALLNRIIEAFSKLLDKGIDYSSKEEHFEDIARSNNHLLEFIEESSLVECSSSEGLNVSEVYEFYVQWCLSSGLAHDKSEISKSAFISDSDKFISNPAEISKKLGDCLPNIKRGRVKRDGKSTRVIGLKRG
jgi:P4 family phage/plasmid primase-like protien